MFSIPSFSGFKKSAASIPPATSGYIHGGSFAFADSLRVNTLDKVSYTNVRDSVFSANKGDGNAFAGFTHPSNYFVRDIIEYKSGSLKYHLMVCGQFNLYYGGQACSNVARLTADGLLDTSFNVGTGFDADVAHMHLDEVNQKIYAVGNFTSVNGVSSNRIVVLNYDGSIHSTLGTGFNNSCQTIDADANNIYVGGAFTSYNGNAVNRYAIIDKSTGALLNGGGAGFNSDLMYLKIDANDPDYVICGGNGAFTSYNGVSCKQRIARIHTPTDSLDTTFDAQVNNFGARVAYIDFANSGNVIVGGNFTNYNASGKNYIVQLNPNGSLNGTFNPPNPSLGLRGSVNFPSINKIGIYGSFTNYGGVATRQRVAVIDAVTGAIDTNFSNQYWQGPGQDGWVGIEI